MEKSYRLPLSQRVKIINRKIIEDERGWFLKVITGNEDCLPQHTGEIYLTMGKPGQSKGGHYHLKAFEWFTVIGGSATLKLEDIETHECMEIEMSLKKPITVFVPNNIAHSVMNSGRNDFILLAYTDRLYDPQDTIPYLMK